MSFITQLDGHKGGKILPEAEDPHVDNILKVSRAAVVGVATALIGHAPFGSPVVPEETEHDWVVDRWPGKGLALLESREN